MQILLPKSQQTKGAGSDWPHLRGRPRALLTTEYSTDYTELNLCNLWIKNPASLTTLSQLLSDPSCFRQSHNSAGAFHRSKSRLPASPSLRAVQALSSTSPVAPGKPPRKAESNDGHPQVGTDRVWQCVLESSCRQQDRLDATKARCRSVTNPSRAPRRTSSRTSSRNPDNHQLVT